MHHTIRSISNQLNPTISAAKSYWIFIELNEQFFLTAYQRYKHRYSGRICRLCGSGGREVIEKGGCGADWLTPLGIIVARFSSRTVGGRASRDDSP